MKSELPLSLNSRALSFPKKTLLKFFFHSEIFMHIPIYFEKADKYNHTKHVVLNLVTFQLSVYPRILPRAKTDHLTLF